MQGMPPYTYAIIGGVAVVMIVGMIFGVKKSLGRARGAAQGMTDGLARLGLQVAEQSGPVVKFQGTFRGAPATMVSDGSGLMKAASRSTFEGLTVGTGLAWTKDEWTSDWVAFKAKQRVQNAPMSFRWTIQASKPLPRLFITHDKSDGDVQLGAGLFAKIAAESQGALSTPEVVAALGKARFDAVRTSGNEVEAVWMPPMREYQKVAAPPSAYVAMNEQVLAALSAVAAALDS